MAQFSQAIAIMRKNFAVKFSPTKLMNTCLEMGMPLFYAAFIFVFVGFLEDIDTPATSYLVSRPLTPAASCSGAQRMAYVPDGALELGVMQAMLVEANISCPLEGYADYPTMRAALLRDSQYLRTVTTAAFVLNLSASTYTVLPQILDFAEPPFDPSDAGILSYYQRDTPFDLTEIASPWVGSGIPPLLAALDRVLAERHTPGASALISQTLTSNMSVAKLPIAAFKSSYKPDSDFILYLVPFYVTYGIAQILQMTFKSLVIEREKRLVEGMSMMGLTTRANNLGWYMTFAVMQVLSPLVTTLIVYASGFVENSNLFFLYLTLLFHLIGVVALTFLLLPLAPSSGVSEMFAIFVTVLPAAGLYFANKATDYPPGFFWASCIVSVAAAPLGVSRFIQAEKDGNGLNSVTEGEFPLIAIWAFQLFDVVLYSLLAWYLNQVIPPPGAAGDRKPWNFCLPRWCGGADLFPPEIVTNDSRGSLLLQPNGASVKVESLYKTYPSRPSPVHAVNDLSFEMLDGEVTGLLGQNGAGKSTAINMLCGLVKPTKGKAVVLGHDVVLSMDKIRAISGVCPQHDLLFGELSVMQHVQLFASIKGIDPKEANKQADEWLERLDMKAKRHTPTDTLSGGQRRKASLMIALLGKPKFVLLDEPTAGMDPKSRRSVWDFVESSKAGRATLLTTHFMDEADVLCSRIVVVSKGTCAAVGSPSELKERFASGYHLVLALTPDAQGAVSGGERLLEFTQKHVRDAVLEDSSAEQAALTLPATSSASFPSLFAELDTSSESLGVSSYGVSLPSLQEAFVKILDSQKGAGGYLETQGKPEEATSGVGGADFAYKPAPLSAQLGIVTSKAWMQFKSDMKSSVQSIIGISLLVVLAFCIGEWTASSKARINPNVPNAVTLSPTAFSDIHGADYSLPYMPASTLDAVLGRGSSLQAKYGFTPTPLYAPLNDSDFDATHRTLSNNFSYDAGLFAAYAMPNLNSTVGSQTTVLQNSSYPNTFPVYFHLLYQALIDTAAPGLEVTARIGKLPSIADDADDEAAGADTTLQIAPIIMVFAMLTAVLTTATRLANERFHHTKQLMLLSGMDPRMFWLGYFIWDSLILLLTIVAVGSIAGTAVGSLKGEAVLPLIIAELCALPGVIVFSYVITAPFSSAEQASGFLVALFMVCGLLPTIIMGAVDNQTVKFVIQLLLLVTPPGQIVTAITSVLNIQKISIEQVASGGEAKSTSDYFTLVFQIKTWNLGDGALEENTAVGCGLVIIVASVMSLCLCYMLYFTEIMKYTAPRSTMSTHKSELKRERKKVRNDDEVEDEDVVAERERVKAMPKGCPDAAVRVQGLVKLFNVGFWAEFFDLKPMLSVDDVSFAIAPNTCFALLGPNGAGKTTTINMLGGEFAPTAGFTQLNHLPASASLSRVFQHTGFCPQLKGLWEALTLREHLTIILRLKGLSGDELERAISTVVKGYGLEAHVNKSAKQLSGGTQRKLSAALALSCGKPKVVFVDEPTTGVDVGTRRFIWDRIKEATRQCVVMLTTHYMDEADALAQRIGIMVKGRMRVIGSPQHLKTRHGGGYTIQLKAAAETEALLAEAERGLIKLVNELFTGVKRAEAREGELIFEVAQGFEFAKVFAALEEAKQTLGLQFFSMSQTSLETVFLRVAEKYGVAKKKEKKPKSKSAVPASDDVATAATSPDSVVSGV